jgi:hypothetical protein
MSTVTDIITMPVEMAISAVLYAIAAFFLFRRLSQPEFHGAIAGLEAPTD